MRIVHLSDTHLAEGGALHNGVVDTAAALRRVLAAAGEVPEVDAVVLTGDLSDDGSAASYRQLKQLVDPWAAERGAAVVYLMGNHDGRGGFEEVIGPRTGTVTVGGVRLFRLDSSVPGFGYGRIGAEQLAWLEAELRAGGPTVVALHHPPTPAISPLLTALELTDPGPLLDICAAAEVRAILAGHYHHALSTVERGIPVFVAPGITNTTLPHGPAGHERAAFGSGFAVVDLPDTGSPCVTVQHVAGPRDGELIFDLGPGEVARIAAAAGPQG